MSFYSALRTTVINGSELLPVRESCASRTMTDKIAIDGTPSNTPRRTLGIRRRVVNSAPLPSRPIIVEPASPLKTTGRLPAKKSIQTESHNRQEDNSYATPVIPKRRRPSEATPATVDRTKKTITRKKLNLSLETSPERAPAPPAAKETITDVLSDIERIEAEIEVMKSHDQRKRLLNDSIDQWKASALEALQELQGKVEPKQTIAAILDHLKIPHEMFDIDALDGD